MEKIKLTCAKSSSKLFAGVESEKTLNLCKARENMQVKIACKQVTGAKRGKSLANAKSYETFNLCQARDSTQPAARCNVREICNRC